MIHMMIDHQPTAIRLSGVHKSFPSRSGTVHAVRGVDLAIASGEVIAFLGPNGAGKTTTLDMLLGFTRPDHGTVRVLDLEPRHAVEAGRIGAVLQTGGLLRDITVGETADLVASLYLQAQPVDEVLRQAGLSDKRDRKVSKCSGGEQQRLRFALSLLPDPDLLILDEPTAGMDVAARREFWDAMHASADAGRTVVFATHYLEEAEAFADRIVLMSKGRIVADGPTDEIRRRSNARSVRATVVDHELAASRLESLGATVSFDGNRLTASVGDSDEAARRLLGLGANGLEISAPSLEDAFIALTDVSAT